MFTLIRPTRLLLAFMLAVATALALTWARPAPAYAAADMIDRFDIAYTVQPSGVLEVKETIVWHFGDDSGRHGIDRWLIVREPYDETQDAVYGVTDISVTSPDPGVATQFDASHTEEKQDGREKQLRIRIGDPDRTISAATATYVISYHVTGAMRTFSGYDEFFWDATGFGNPWIKNTAITAKVPGGAQEVSCFTGPPGSKSPCQEAKFTKDGPATFKQLIIPSGQGMSIGIKIKPGLVTDNQPHLEPDGSKLTSGEKTGLLAAAGVGGAILVGSPLVGMLWWRKNGRDQRYAGLAPGTTPLAGQSANVVASDPDMEIPVAFTPPRIPVAEAGLLVDGQVDTRETAATIIDLAVRGAVKVQSTDPGEFRVILVDPERAAAPHEMVLLTSLFDGRPSGAERSLSTQGSLLDAHTKMRDSVRNQVTARGWFRKVPSASATGSFGFGAIALTVFGAFAVGAWVLWVLVPLLPIIITLAVIRFKLRRGQRTAEGRAVCDQVEGFKTYLATAEADQLRFEEGEDIFSKYLPWAIIFELADRWAKVCGDLVAMGRLPDATPYWYIGNYHQMSAFNTGFITSSLTSAATPAPSASSSGSGFGGGSSFSGGGFSGGGGGGGGSSSW
jgi:uncharacterized membrane protein YgcG